VPKEHMTVRGHQEADFGIEKLPKLARHPHRVHKSPHEIINETDETKTSTELDQNEDLEGQQHIFSGAGLWGTAPSARPAHLQR